MSQEHQQSATGSPLSGDLGRRGLLLGAGIAGVAGLAAACGGGGGGGGSSSGGGSPQGGGAGGGTSLGNASDIPVGGGKIFTDAKVVVTQPSQGEFKAFSAVCTHQGCTVGSVSGGLIHCPCHGSEYRITDGSVAQPPAPAPLPPKKITVSGGEITLA
ncbi:Rieske (2Fe-2S) protein [Actinomadura harenae]|uniref:Cytochrome bc1 complex Rieske iron-sulfur subunit n=1 Tax=Actinomadura harenae TaxID=2483351 RepID=A0A3M2M758_9ACTN|nr:Rieske (2Fe-2S) protein [Actinomadura harenae]RMI42938.1 Rieske (2Fe-2S) protein [Actinomadura harenae]